VDLIATNFANYAKTTTTRHAHDTVIHVRPSDTLNFENGVLAAEVAEKLRKAKSLEGNR
jgi:hypothetical protein